MRTIADDGSKLDKWCFIEGYLTPCRYHSPYPKEGYCFVVVANGWVTSRRMFDTREAAREFQCSQENKSKPSHECSSSTQMDLFSTGGH